MEGMAEPLLVCRNYAAEWLCMQERVLAASHVPWGRKEGWKQPITTITPHLKLFYILTTCEAAACL